MSATRDKILEKYLRVCKSASDDDKVFATFKSHPDYHEVLEHCPVNLGWAHFENIKANNPKLLEGELIHKFLHNDKYGSPKTSNFGAFTASPTTVQYISVLSNLTDTFKSLKGFKMIELGAGYGGQAKIIQDRFNIGRYDIIDLYECTLLQEKYLTKLKCFGNVEVYTNENYEAKEYDLILSNYALSEVSDADQLKYVKDICLNSKHGYLTCNQPLNGLDLIKEKYNVKISKDIKGERETNYLVTW